MFRHHVVTEYCTGGGRSAFFCFCNEERPKVKAKYPNYAVGDIAKELGKRWEACTSRAKYEQMAAKDRARYEKVSSFNKHTHSCA